MWGLLREESVGCLGEKCEFLLFTPSSWYTTCKKLCTSTAQATLDLLSENHLKLDENELLKQPLLSLWL